MRTPALFFQTLFFFLLIGLVSCENGAGTDTGNGEETTMPDSDQQTEAGTAYKLTPFSPSQAYPDAAIVASNYENGRFDFKISAENYQLGAQTPDAPQKMCANSDQGQHIHLILDNEPYAAKYEASFDYEVADGEHYMLAFLSRSYHESIKTDKAFTAQKIQVRNKNIETATSITEPMLFYSRPKGNYVGKKETEKVMLDFYVVNAQLGADYKVKVDVNAEQSFTVDQWMPYYLEGLPMGDNKIKLTLLDKDGNVVDTPLNPVERVFTLQEDPAEGVGK